jgi:hypothetical protein
MAKNDIIAGMFYSNIRFASVIDMYEYLKKFGWYSLEQAKELYEELENLWFARESCDEVGCFI